MEIVKKYFIKVNKENKEKTELFEKQKSHFTQNYQLVTHYYRLYS